MAYEYFRGTPGAAAQRLRRQVDALSDWREPHVFNAEDVRLVIEYLEANERFRLAEHEADERLCEQEESASGGPRPVAACFGTVGPPLSAVGILGCF